MKKLVGSGSISQRYGSWDPDPHQNVMDPQHCYITGPITLGRFSAKDVHLPCENSTWRIFCREKHALSLKRTAVRGIPNVQSTWFYTSCLKSLFL